MTKTIGICLNRKFNIKRAENAGACFGVCRALDMAYGALEKYDNVCSLGELIHNPVCVSSLASLGMRVCKDVEDTSDVVVIRSHGITQETECHLKSQSKTIIDATCPRVKKAQACASMLSATCDLVILVGRAGHPEVESIVSFAEGGKGQIVVVEALEDIPDTLPGRVGILSQTTQRKEKFNSIVDELSRRGIDLEVRDTICSATDKRQSAALQLAKQCDVVFVLGGKKSSNTGKLREICESGCDRVFHVERAEDAQPILEKIIGEEAVQTSNPDFSIGITAGASTPISQIDDLERCVEKTLVTLCN